MKIGQLENKALTPATAERRTGAGAGPSKIEASAQVALSPAVSALGGDGIEGVFDAGKVKRISDAIREGKFHVNAEAIADKLIVNAQELMGNASKS